MPTFVNICQHLFVNFFPERRIRGKSLQTFASTTGKSSVPGQVLTNVGIYILLCDEKSNVLFAEIDG